MVGEKITKMEQLSRHEASEEARALLNTFIDADILVCNHIKNLSNNIVDKAEREDWIKARRVEFRSFMLDLVNINLFISDEDICQVKEINKKFIAALQEDVRKGAEGLKSIPCSDAYNYCSQEETESKILSCLQSLQLMQNKHAEEMNRLSQSPYRQATGACIVSLASLGLMEFWRRHKVNINLNPKYKVGMTYGLYACLAVSSAVLLKSLLTLKGKSQYSHKDKSSEHLSFGSK